MGTPFLFVVYGRVIKLFIDCQRQPRYCNTKLYCHGDCNAKQPTKNWLGKKLYPAQKRINNY